MIDASAAAELQRALVRVDVQIRADGQRARDVVERAHRDAGGVHELDVAHRVRRAAEIGVQLDRSPRPCLLIAASIASVYSARRSGLPRNTLRVSCRDLDGAELKRIRPAHASRIADPRLAQRREVVRDDRAGIRARVSTVEPLADGREIEIRRRVLEAKARLRLHLVELAREQRIAGADVLVIVVRRAAAASDSNVPVEAFRYAASKSFDVVRRVALSPVSSL